VHDDPQNPLSNADDPWNAAGLESSLDAVEMNSDSDSMLRPAVDPLMQQPHKIGPTGHPVIAWCVVLLLIAVILGASLLKTKPVATSVDPAALVILEIQSKYLIGAVELFEMPRQMALQQAEVFDNGPVRNRLCFVALIGELGGPQRALQKLSDLRDPAGDFGLDAMSATDRTIERNLSDLYRELLAERWDAPALTVDQRKQLRSELNWFGQLALAPREGDAVARAKLTRQCRRVVIVVLAAAVLAIGLGVIGLFALPTMVILAVMRVVNFRLRPSRHGGVYAETFAVWMGLFLLSGLAIELLAGDQLSLNLVGFVISGAALGWPVMRGIGWSEVRHEVGLFGGRRWYLEPVCGLISYVCTLPLVGLALLLIVVLMQAGGLPLAQADLNTSELPTHPIVEWVKDAGPWGRFQILLIACCAAPVLEETMFRGVLYRHLRDATAGWKMGLSVCISVGINSLIFAAIHPQGLLAIPALTALAAGFSLAREWRGSLIAPMTAHAMNNLLVTTVLLLIV